MVVVGPAGASKFFQNPGIFGALISRLHNFFRPQNNMTGTKGGPTSTLLFPLCSYFTHKDSMGFNDERCSASALLYALKILW